MDVYLLCSVSPNGAYGQRLAGRLTPAERSSLLGSLIRRADVNAPRSSGVPRGTGRRTLSFSATTPTSSVHAAASLEEVVGEAIGDASA